MQITKNRDSHGEVHCYLLTVPVHQPFVKPWLVVASFYKPYKKKTAIAINCQSEIFTVIKQNIPQKRTSTYILSLILKIVRVTKQQTYKTSRLIASQRRIDIIVSSMTIEEKITVADIYNRICD